jgi:hypothetical protein
LSHVEQRKAPYGDDVLINTTLSAA